MALFSTTTSNLEFLARLVDAEPGLRIRVIDRTEAKDPEWAVQDAISDDLVAVVTWGALVVPVEMPPSGR